LAGALLCSLATWGWGQVRLGPEFQVNTYITGDQRWPEVGLDATGRFVVVWSIGDDIVPSGVFGRRFDAVGAPLGDEFLVNAPTGQIHVHPSLAVAADGRFVVAWEERTRYSTTPFLDDVFARRYDAEGGTEEDPFLVNPASTDFQSRPAVAGTPAGEFTVVWSQRSADDVSNVLGQRYDASGVAEGGIFTVNSSTTVSARFAVATYDANANLVVTWEENSDGSGSAVAVRRFDAMGQPLGPVERANTYTTHSQSYPTIAAGPDGGFVVVWHSYLQDGSFDGLFAQRFDGSGVRRGLEFAVNTYTTLDQYHPAAAFDAKGNFVVAWSSREQDGDGFYSVRARLFDAAGTPQGAEFRVNSIVPSIQAYPSVAFDGNGDFVVVWQGYQGPVFGGSYEIRAQRFAPDLIFRDGFESGALAAWSGSVTDGGDLVGSIPAALKGTAFGLEATVDDAASLYVEDDSPRGEDRYRALFYVNPAGFDPGEAAGRFRTRLFIAFEDNPSRRVAAVVLRRLGGAYSLRGRARLDDDSQSDTPFVPISAGPHFVEIDWRRSSGPDASDGSFEMFIDGTSVSLLTGLDNSISSVDFVRLGALSVKAGASGTLSLDEFESRRASYIGP
jgi:hypothetical protein